MNCAEYHTNVSTPVIEPLGVVIPRYTKRISHFYVIWNLWRNYFFLILYKLSNTYFKGLIFVFHTLGCQDRSMKDIPWSIIWPILTSLLVCYMTRKSLRYALFKLNLCIDLSGEDFLHISATTTDDNNGRQVMAMFYMAHRTRWAQN